MTSLKCFLRISAFLILWVPTAGLQAQPVSGDQFVNPPVRYWPRPLWFWNNTTVDVEGITGQMQAYFSQCGYGGFGIIPFGNEFRPEYLGNDYLALYGVVLKKARELGMYVCIYDECGFPSGSIGAFQEGDGKPRFQLKYPESTIKRLDKEEHTVTGPSVIERTIPVGKMMGVVAMEATNLDRIDITGNVREGVLKWEVPAGTWKVMIFTCVVDGHPVVDYLDPDACKLFTREVHDVYYARFADYFGNTIWGTFFDEPSMFNARFRTWTDRFNEKFETRYGFSPVTLYPSLWYDIGAETQSARNYLLGFRADLYATGFVKVVNDWSVAHGVSATGHHAPEEALIPVNASGDIMKSAKHLEIPGIDKIGGHRPAERFYKLISSAAYNWDKQLVMSETYGAMPNFGEPGDLDWNQIYAVAMDQYTKGINMMIPHAVWYDNTRVTYKPELSHRNPLYADGLKRFTQFLARLNLMLQAGGRHVADIAVLYPIASLQGQHFFDDRTGPANIDGPADPANEFFREQASGIDYVDVANWLTNAAGKDFTFIHPDALDEKCRVSGAALHMDNPVNWEDFKILIVPSCKTISVSNLEKIADLYRNGGVVIFTTQLPCKSAEARRDTDIASLVKSIFPDGERSSGWQSNPAGGKALFVSSPSGEVLRKALAESGVRCDVEYELNPDVQYLHKIVCDQDLYFFANLGGNQVDIPVALRGRHTLEASDPHTGEVRPAKTSTSQAHGDSPEITTVRLSLKPYHCCFWISRP